AENETCKDDVEECILARLEFSLFLHQYETLLGCIKDEQVIVTGFIDDLDEPFLQAYKVRWDFIARYVRRIQSGLGIQSGRQALGQILLENTVQLLRHVLGNQVFFNKMHNPHNTQGE